MPRQSRTWRLALCAAVLALVAPLAALPAPRAHAAESGLSLRYRTHSSPTSNQITPLISVVNTGTSSVSLSGVTIRYWFTAEGASTPRYYCDYTPRGCRNVTSTLVTIPHPTPTADTFLQIGFTTGAGSLAPGQSTGEISGRIAKSDWSPFNQTNDYSYDATTRTPTEWDRITVYRNGTPVWGVEPTATAPGRSDAQNLAVWGFSQSNVDEPDDPQIYQLDPDVNLRVIGKWSTMGDEPADYNFAQIARYHDKGIRFIGGGTVSVIFPGDFPTTEVFEDMVTRDADNVPVPHSEVTAGAYRGNWFNPEYRQYLLNWARIQVDGGVDGIFFDEVSSGFSGGVAHNWNGNEGFDDYTIADFNRYLLDRYPSYTAADWKSRFGMTEDNLLRRDVPADDLTNNFNYRDYLAANGWNTAPLSTANPLAVEWGDVTDNRLYADNTSFTVSYLRRYWKQFVDDVRAYARRTTGRYLLVTANGLFPYVDFNSVGMYPWNPDEQTPDFRGADYVPVVDGHLNGAKSLQANYRYLKNKSREIAGDVPVVVFIDWPTEMMTNYLNLPTEEQKDYWRIFGADVNGIFPTFHLRDTVGGPTAEQQGLLEFLSTYAQFYADHRARFLRNDIAPGTTTTSTANVASSLLTQRDTGTRTLHLVNHNYHQGIQPQTGITVSTEVGSCPTTVSMISPDFTGTRNVPASCTGGTLTVTVDRLDYYNVLVLE